MPVLKSMSGYLLAGLLVGARLGHCLFYDFAYYSHHVAEIFLPFSMLNGRFRITGYSGLVSHGGAIGVLAAMTIWELKHLDRSMLSALDIIAVGVPVAAVSIRIGNFMNSEIIGKLTAGNWGIIFARVDSMPRHPGQLYEAAVYFVVFVIMAILYTKTELIQHRGKLFGILLILAFYALIALETLKENQSVFESGLPLNMGQMLSIPFILAGIFLVLRREKGEAE